jgi:hypothetical protein
MVLSNSLHPTGTDPINARKKANDSANGTPPFYAE